MERLNTLKLTMHISFDLLTTFHTTPNPLAPIEG